MPDVSSRIATIPNLLTLVRLLLIPVFLSFIAVERYGSALLIVAVSSITDFLDGFVARRYGQVSRVGQLLDPAADRLFILSTLLGIAWAHIVPWWFLAVIVLRDVLLLVLGVVLANAGYGPLPVHHLGKMGTFCLLFGFPVLLLGAAVPDLAPFSNPIGWGVTIWGAFLYWWAGWAYLREAVRLAHGARVAGSASSVTLDR
ncbi:MAG: CDP-alcohol phosphatidyltransferase family protein [Micrococcales bacterium]|nr:CDP-alcohol phosphatidyltransferase family protein [Micrococcales bacterium]